MTRLATPLPVLMILLIAAGCADLQESMEKGGTSVKGSMKKHGVEVKHGKVMRVFKF